MGKILTYTIRVIYYFLQYSMYMGNPSSKMNEIIDPTVQFLKVLKNAQGRIKNIKIPGNPREGL